VVACSGSSRSRPQVPGSSRCRPARTYAPVLPGAACVELGLVEAADAEVYCLVTVPDGDVSSATANLRAPVVVNAATHQARQVVLPDGNHPIRRPLRR
jgi:flagellar assembly factor FliW